MKVLIISTNTNQYPVPVMPIGACMVAEAVEESGHQVEFLDLMFASDPSVIIQRKLQSVQPDVIGISVRNIDNNDIQSPRFFIKELLTVMKIIRRFYSGEVVLGGSALPIMPEELLRFTGISWACLGDGEKFFPEFLVRLSRVELPGDLPGMAWIKDGKFGYNPPSASEGKKSFRSPDFMRWIDVKAYLSRMSTVPLQTKLGCHFKCIYCTYRKIEGTHYRLSDPAEAADAVLSLSRRGLRHIEFVDNVFNSPYEHAMSICECLAGLKHGASLQSLELNPLYIDDELIAVMERAGFSGIGITVESASDVVLEGLRKGFDASHVYRSAEIIKRHSLPCVWIFMLGGPYETKQTVTETLNFAENYIRPRDVAFFGSGIRIYPGTELESLARRQGFLSLTPKEMLEPVFYLSPSVEYSWMQKQIKTFMCKHMNFMNADSIGFPILPAIHRIAFKLGLSPPLWKHTRLIRRGLRIIGMDV